MPCLVLAETFTKIVSPPHSSETSSCSDSLLRIDVGVGARLVDLVDRDDDRHLGLLGVVDGLDGLRHRAVVGGDDQDDDVRHLGAAGAHGGERLVAGRVQEDDVAAVAGAPCRRRCAG